VKKALKDGCVDQGFISIEKVKVMDIQDFQQVYKILKEVTT